MTSFLIVLLVGSFVVVRAIVIIRLAAIHEEWTSDYLRKYFRATPRQSIETARENGRIRDL
jgi:hypothetical protein